MSEKGVDKSDYISILITPHDGEISCRCIVQFLVLTLGIFICFLCNGYITEDLFRMQGFRHFGWFLTLVQLLTYLALSTLDLLRQGRFTKFSRVPVGLYLLLAVLTIGSTGLSNVSVGYLNYPTQLIFKSCKIVPVMCGGAILLGKRYCVISYAAACCMSIGLIIFCLADANLSPNFEIKGVVLVCISLIGDAAIGNTQEKMFKVYKMPNNEMLFYTSSIGSLIILIGLLSTGQFQEAVQFCDQNSSSHIYPKMVLFGVCGYFGVNLILVLLKSFGAVAAVCVTTCRKAVTLCLSFIIFVKPFSFTYVWSGCLVLLGIYLNLYASHKLATHRLVNGLLYSLKTVCTDVSTKLRSSRFCKPKQTLYIL